MDPFSSHPQILFCRRQTHLGVYFLLDEQCNNFEVFLKLILISIKNKEILCFSLSRLTSLQNICFQTVISYISSITPVERFDLPCQNNTSYDFIFSQITDSPVLLSEVDSKARLTCLAVRQAPSLVSEEKETSQQTTKRVTESKSGEKLGFALLKYLLLKMYRIFLVYSRYDLNTLKQNSIHTDILYTPTLCKIGREDIT